MSNVMKDGNVATDGDYVMYNQPESCHFFKVENGQLKHVALWTAGSIGAFDVDNHIKRLQELESSLGDRFADHYIKLKEKFVIENMELATEQMISTLKELEEES